ncbi:DNA polymerase III subunit epsilon [Carboxydothermus islandicus]|uniref:DNA polymerase III subunit epsilon n=1 Tax=Carboxydothermus islandicus TaxID=661089 RepID=A0A1L8D3N7_9THEO|nr:3'-5' exonuclease [Carboxydothermus islandicus]GAV25717.1 DNA polymerase III subunit epsilon [Carboxydothermus islandicus]
MIRSIRKFLEPNKNPLRTKIEKINAFYPYDIPLINLTYTVIDLETTGLKPFQGDEIIAIGAVKIINGNITRPTFHAYVNPQREIPEIVQRLTGISPKTVQNAPPLINTLTTFLDFADNSVIVGHSVNFDLAFLNKHLTSLTGKKLTPRILDTVDLGLYLFPREPNYSLENFAQKFAISLRGRHTALGDAIICAKVFLNFLKILELKNINTWWQLSQEIYKVL